MSFSGTFKRYACCPYRENRFDLQPRSNLVKLRMSGFLYSSVPVFFDSFGQRQIPLTFSIDPNRVVYMYSFYLREGEEIEYHLSTSEEVTPVIFEEVRGVHLRVSKITSHNGYTSWVITE